MTIRSFIFLAMIVMPIGNAQASFKQLRKLNPHLSLSFVKRSSYSSEPSGAVLFFAVARNVIALTVFYQFCTVCTSVKNYCDTHTKHMQMAMENGHKANFFNDK